MPIYQWQFGRAPEIPPFSMAEEGVQISVPPIRSVECTLRLHQAVEASVGTPVSARNTLDNVLRRHVSHGTVQDSTGETTDPDYFSPGNTRICGQPGEVPVTTNPEDPVLRVPDRLSADEDLVDRRENRALISSMQDGTTARISLSEGAGLLNREADSNIASHIPGPIVVPRAATTEERSPTEFPLL